METTNQPDQAKAAAKLLAVADHIARGHLPPQVLRIIDRQLLHSPATEDNPHPPGWLAVRYTALERIAGDDGLEEAATIGAALGVLARIMRDKRLPDDPDERQRMADTLRAVCPPPAGDDQDWMLVSEAVAELPFIANLKALDRYAAKHPGKLRLRDHPHHKKRRQAHRADVQRLVQEHNGREFAALDGTAADDLPAISEAGVEALVARMSRERQKKAGK